MAHRNDHYFNYYSSHSSSGGQETNHDNFQEFTDQALYESDEFRMYTYKIKKCAILRCHDWTSCPFTHRGEKARRRDPRQYNYLPIPCPSYKFALCLKGDNCNLCHGVFEYWLHPAKYRTHPCYAGMACERRVCFFAHTPKELRPETKYNWCYVYQYPLDIQPYPDILIENEPNGNWMVIPCNPQLPLPPNDQAGLENSSIPQQISQKSTSFFISGVLAPISKGPEKLSTYESGIEPTYELFVSSHPSSSQSQPKTDQRIQNEDDFSFFSASHAKLAEELKNLEIGSTSHGKVNKIYDEKGKRLLEFESQNQKFSNINWVSDLLVDEFEGRRL